MTMETKVKCEKGKKWYLVSLVRDGREEERLDREAKRQLERFKEVNEESKERPGRKENSKRTK